MPTMFYFLIFSLFILTSHAQTITPKKIIEFEDIMKIKQIKEVTISNDGVWAAVSASPDRGNKELQIINLRSGAKYTFERGDTPLFNETATHCAFVQQPDFFESEAKKTDPPLASAVLVNLSTGDTVLLRNADKPVFSRNGGWFFAQFSQPDTAKTKLKDKDKAKPFFQIKSLYARKLKDTVVTTILNTVDYAIDSTSSVLAYSIADTLKSDYALKYVRLDISNGQEETIASDSGKFFGGLTWNSRGELAFLKAGKKSAAEALPAELLLWNPKLESLAKDLKPGWNIPFKNKLRWTNDNRYLFFAAQKADTQKAKPAYDTTMDNRFTIDSIITKAEFDLWHWNDPYIKTHDKKKFKDNKSPLFTQAIDMEQRRVRYLADSTITDIIANNSGSALGYTNLPYSKEVTWDDYYYDAYSFNLSGGNGKKFASHLRSLPVLSPGGGFAVWYDSLHWFVHSLLSGTTQNVTKEIKQSFGNEENDLPALPAEYGFGGWIGKDSICLLYDRYDMWAVPLNGGTKRNLTAGAGRKNKLVFRVVKTDKEREWFSASDTLLLTAFSEEEKFTKLYRLALGNGELTPIIDEPCKAVFKAKAKNAGTLLFTRESYRDFPDLWQMRGFALLPARVTSFSSQIDSFKWSSARLMKWKSKDGKPLHGVLIEPVDFQKDKRYPVLIYFYEIFSNRLFDFMDMVVNHRPNFPFYAAHGYAVFLPDVKFRVGEPGKSALDCILPGVDELIRQGIADPKAIGLHGHSWSGYQTAFMITGTDRFAAACAGAPVANMTSAYSGIRNESGMARQFQYEKAQSRIGGNLWKKRDAFIANSPLFFADKIHTPLLIMHGDEDEAVPFQQGVELYMAMRRLGKTAYFLQYRGEMHWPRKAPNKIDYAIRMKQFFDYYLLHTPMPGWMEKGIPYKD